VVCPDFIDRKPRDTRGGLCGKTALGASSV
jgi:hypothetical protein